MHLAGAGAAVAAVVVSLSVGTAGAAEQAPGVHLGLSAGAQFPVSADVQLEIEGPGRLRIYGGAGLVPSQFLDAVNRAFVSFGAYRPELGNFVLGHVEDTRVLHAGAGWRPFSRSGFFLQGGYTQVLFSASASGQELISSFAPSSVKASALRISVPSVGVTTSLDMAELQAGWEWSLGPMFLRGSVGGDVALRSRTQVYLLGAEGEHQGAGPLGDVAADAIDQALERYARAPFVGFQLGFRLF